MDNSIIVLLFIPMIFIYGEILYIHTGRNLCNNYKNNKDVNSLIYETKIKKKYPDNTAFEIIAKIGFNLLLIPLLTVAIIGYISLAKIKKWSLYFPQDLVEFADNIPQLIFSGLLGVVACLGIFAKWVKIDCIVFDLKDIYQKVPIVDKMKKIIVYSVVTFAISIINKFRLITELHISFYIILIVYFLCFLYNIFYIIFNLLIFALIT